MFRILSNSIEKKKKEEKLKHQKTFYEKIFLWVAMFCALIHAVFTPVLNGPDDMYHFDSEAYMGNIVVNREYLSQELYGTTDRLNSSKRFSSLKEKTYFSDMFLTKAKRVEKEYVKDVRIKKQAPFQKIGHLLPAIGMRIGYMIYPSIGVMVVSAKLFTAFVILLILYFVIRKLQYGKTIFMFTILSPATMGSIVSLNYDGTTVLVAAIFLGQLINLSVQKEKISWNKFLLLIVNVLLVFFGAKTNLLLLLALILFLPPLIFGEKVAKLCEDIGELFQKKAFKRTMILLFPLAVIAVIFLMRSTIFYFAWQVVKTFLRSNSPGYIVQEVFAGTVLQRPPTAVAYLWFAFFVFIIFNGEFSDKKSSKAFTFSSLALYFVNFLGILWMYKYYNSSVAHRSLYISGVQGRYFIPFLLSFAPFGAFMKKGDNKISEKMLYSFLFVFAIISTIWVVLANVVYPYQ